MCWVQELIIHKELSATFAAAPITCSVATSWQYGQSPSWHRHITGVYGAPARLARRIVKLWGHGPGASAGHTASLGLDGPLLHTHTS